MNHSLKGIPTFACICGCMVMNLKVVFDEETRLVGWYDTGMECDMCGMQLTAPTPIDDGADCA